MVEQSRPRCWIVAWGRPGRFDWHTVEVEAYDEDEARATARELHPDLPPPPYAFLSGSPVPPAPGPRRGQRIPRTAGSSE